MVKECDSRSFAYRLVLCILMGFQALLAGIEQATLITLVGWEMGMQGFDMTYQVFNPFIHLLTVRTLGVPGNMVILPMSVKNPEVSKVWPVYTIWMQSFRFLPYTMCIVHMHFCNAMIIMAEIAFWHRTQGSMLTQMGGTEVCLPCLV